MGKDTTLPSSFEDSGFEHSAQDLRIQSAIMPVKSVTPLGLSQTKKILLAHLGLSGKVYAQMSVSYRVTSLNAPYSCINP